MLIIIGIIYKAAKIQTHQALNDLTSSTSLVFVIQALFLTATFPSRDNISTFRRLLKTADYSSVFSTTDANEAYYKFMNVYKSLLEISCPVKIIKLHRKFIKREPWITNGLIISSINKANLLKKETKKTEPRISKQI